MTNGQQQTSGTQQSSPNAGANQNRFNIDIVAALVPKTRGGWVVAFILFGVLFASYFYNFFRFRDLVKTFGLTLIGFITVIVMICFIIYGWRSWLKSKGENIASFYIATALFIWLLDLVPENTWIIGQLLGPEWAGFEWIPLVNNWTIPFVSVFFSAAFFSLMYISLVLNIIKKEGWQIFFGLLFILSSNYIVTKFFPNYLSLNFSVPYPKFSFIIVLVLIGVTGYLAYRLDRKHTGTAIPEFFSSVFMYFVFSFFLVNNGWQSNLRAWFHAIFILGFGFGYIKTKELSNTILYKIFIPVFLLIDFFGYGILWSSDLLALRLIPPFVIIVIFYCYVKESNEIEGKRKATYPVLAFILLVTFILVMSINVAGIESEGTIPFVVKKGTTFQEIYSQFTNRLRESIEGRLDIATAGLYRGNVEKNRYESLGVYFGNIRAADPRFYTDEPITIWGTIRSKTYKDAVIVNFNCSRWKDSKRIYADKVIPEIRFPIFTLEEVDTQCTFLPKTENPVPAGANIVTLSAEYNFGTDSYLKAYFMDRERFRASAREGVDPLTQFGIKDKTPAAVFTNGPVEIGLSAGPLVTVSEGYAIKPIIGITLTNRKEIQDKDKRIITRWEGKIKNITELILLTPYGITLGTPDKLEKCKEPKTEQEKLECPCSMPFSSYDEQGCYNSCAQQVLKPCNIACAAVHKDSKDPDAEILCNKDCSLVSDKCLEECRFLFQVNEGEGPTKEKYNAYALDVGSKQFKDLNKDIDKSRSFVCRFEPSSAVLGDSPITTRYFRVRARYNYLLENSVTVNVEPVPVGAANTVPDAVVKTASDIRQGHPLWFEGYSNELISAIASVESNFKHCCQEQQSYEIGKKIPGAKCTPTGQTECDFNYLLTSGLSYGVMQINYVGTNKEWADRLANEYCKKDSSGKDIKINNYNCNLLVGIAILKSKYETFKDGCGKYPKISKACNICRSNIAPYTQYSSYRGVEAALRGYNGWGCPASGAVYGDAGYVENILRAKTTVKGKDIVDSSTLGSISRKGTGMADSSPTQSEDTQAGVQNIPELSPINVRASYNYQSQVVTIRWDKLSSPNVTSYDVTRSSADEPEVIVQGCQDIKEEGSDNYCREAGQILIAGKQYTYTVYAYDNKGQYSGTKTYMTK